MCRGAADKKTTHCGCDGAQRGARGAHLPYLVNDMGNPWVKKFDPYLSSRGTGGFRAVWMMFERLEGVVAVAFRAMEGVAGREGPPFTFRAMERVAAGRGTPPLAFRATERVAAGRGTPPLVFRATGRLVAGRRTSPLAFRATEGGKVAGSCRLSVTVVCEQKV